MFKFFLYSENFLKINDDDDDLIEKFSKTRIGFHWLVIMQLEENGTKIN